MSIKYYNFLCIISFFPFIQRVSHDTCMHHVALYPITEFRPKCNKLSGFRKGLERDVNIVKVCSFFAIQAALYTIVFSSNKKRERERRVCRDWYLYTIPQVISEPLVFSFELFFFLSFTTLPVSLFC